MKLQRGLIVSSQALDGNPLKNSESLAVMAEAAAIGGAVAIRANGFLNILAMKNRVKIPIIGIHKMIDKEGTTIITPTFDAASEAARAGAEVIALDATFRTSEIKEDTEALIARIHNELGLEVMADISTLEEALNAEKIGADYVSTTLSGYTKDRPYKSYEKYLPDFSLIKKILDSGIGIPVIAEGRFWRPEDLRFALKMGVHAIVIGKAITNPMAITTYFCQAASEALAADGDWVKTEERNEKTVDIDRASTWDVLRQINEEDAVVADKVREKLDDIAAVVDVIVPNFKKGGRVLYCGAGTSGRLAVADAAECGPTYGVYNRVIASIAGGRDAVFAPSEDFEDSYEAGMNAARELGMGALDVAIGISANGNAAYCLGFVAYAKSVGCKTVAIVNNLGTRLAEVCDYKIELLTGAEVIKGSTRMKAGTSQKMVLNMMSTAIFIRSGYVKSNLMVNLKANNKKLRKRAMAMLTILTEESESVCRAALEKHDWSVADALKEFNIDESRSEREGYEGDQ